jgi:WD40 repeat protein
MRLRIFSIFILLVNLHLNAQKIDLVVQRGHLSPITKIKYGNQGRILATLDQNNIIIIWDILLGKKLHEIPDMNGKITNFYFDNSDLLLAIKTASGSYTFDIVNDSIFYSPFPEKIKASEYSGAIKGAKLKIFRNGKHYYSRTADYFDKSFTDIAISEKTNRIIATNEDHHIYVFNLSNGKRITKIKKHRSQVKTISFSPDEETFATAGNDRMICIWNSRNLKLEKKIVLTAFAVTTINYIKSDGILLSGNEIGQVNVLGINDPRLSLQTLNQSSYPVRGIFTKNDSTAIVIGCDNEIKNLNLKTLTIERLVKIEKNANVWSILFNLLYKNFGYFPKERTHIVSAGMNSDAQYVLTNHMVYYAKFDSPRNLLVPKIGIHNIKNNKTETIVNYTSSIEYAGFLNNNVIISAGDQNGIIDYWLFRRNKIFHRADTLSIIPQSIALINDSIFCISTTSELVLFDFKNSRIINKVECPTSYLLKYAPEVSKVFLVDFGNNIHIFDYKNRDLKHKAILTGHSGQITDIKVLDDNLLSTSSMDATIRLWDIENAVQILNLILLQGGRKIITTPEDYYFSDKKSLQSIVFRAKGKVFLPEQFDLKYNRPDIVLSRLGYADSNLIAAYHQAYLKRIKKMGFTEDQLSGEFHIPESAIENFEYMPVIEENDIELDMNFNDSKYNLDRYNIWINDVPLFGMAGRSLRHLNTSEFSVKEKILLMPGENKIQVSCLNEKGAESYKETVSIRCNPKNPPQPGLYFIGIGVDRYAQAGHDLKYSVKDIRDLCAALSEKYGRNISIDTLFNEKVNNENLMSLKSKLLQSDINDKVIISFSGHGLLSSSFDYYLATYHTDFGKPENGGLAYERLEWLLDSIPARQKLLLIDACHSGEVDKDELLARENKQTDQGVKGITLDYTYKPTLGMKNSFELMQELFSNLNRGTGATVISAAAGTQYAFERGDLSNGVFTYSILELMKTESSMTVNRLKELTGKRVEELTKGLQKPTSRSENMEFDWRVW